MRNGQVEKEKRKTFITLIKSLDVETDTKLLQIIQTTLIIYHKGFSK